MFGFVPRSQAAAVQQTPPWQSLGAPQLTWQLLPSQVVVPAQASGPSQWTAVTGASLVTWLGQDCSPVQLTLHCCTSPLQVICPQALPPPQRMSQSFAEHCTALGQELPPAQLTRQ